jgi:hypothetical protein
MSLSPEDIADIKVGRAFEAMLATEGWKHYERLVNQHIASHTARALQPFMVKQENKASHQVLFSAVDQLLSSEADKGAIMGLTLALTLPTAIISNMTDLLSKSKEGDDDAT